MALAQTVGIAVGAATTPVPLLWGGDFLGYAVLFVVLALVAGLLGARGVAGISMTIAKWLVIAFLVLAVLSILL